MAAVHCSEQGCQWPEEETAVINEAKMREEHAEDDINN